MSTRWSLVLCKIWLESMQKFWQCACFNILHARLEKAYSRPQFPPNMGFWWIWSLNGERQQCNPNRHILAQKHIIYHVVAAPHGFVPGMCGQTRNVVIYCRFHWNPFRGFGATGGRHMPFPITLAIRRVTWRHGIYGYYTIVILWVGITWHIVWS